MKESNVMVIRPTCRPAKFFQQWLSEDWMGDSPQPLTKNNSWLRTIEPESFVRPVD